MLTPFIAGSALAFALATGAAAAPVLYDVDLVFNQGPLRNQLYEGTFSIEGDAFGGTGTEVFAAAGSDRQLLSFDIVVGGDVYAIAGADEPEASQVTFIDGEFSRFEYYGTASNANSIMAIDNAVRYRDRSSGKISYGTYVARPAAIAALAPVPSPPAAALLASGIALLLARRRWLKAATGATA